MSEQPCSMCLSEGLGDLAELTSYACRVCGNNFCDRHKSEIDPDLCFACTEAPKLDVTSKPLIDDEGITHTGRQMAITGETWFSQCRVISDMNEEELRKWNDKYKMLIHDAEKALDYRRVMHSMIEFEQGDRQRGRHKRLASLSRASSSLYKTDSGSTQVRTSKPVNPITKIAQGFKKAGATKEQLIAMYEAMKNNGK